MGVPHAAAITLTLLLAAPSLSAQKLSARAAVERARAYVLTWQQSLAAVVAEERYTQKLRSLPLGRFPTDENPTSTRTLLSDVLLVRAGGGEWLMFRDVMAVNGDAVRDRKRRFDDLFTRSDVNVVTTARKIADEGARYNLGNLFRNVNTPSAALIFLGENYESSVKWSEPKGADVDGRAVLRLDFEQKRAPFAIRSLDGEGMPAVGTFWVEPASGRIVRTELEVTAVITRPPRRGRATRVTSTMRVLADYGPAPGLDPWVPLRMADEYELMSRDGEEQLTAEAVYSNHRIFQTAGRIIGERR